MVEKKCATCNLYRPDDEWGGDCLLRLPKWLANYLHVTYDEDLSIGTYPHSSCSFWRENPEAPK